MKLNIIKSKKDGDLLLKIGFRKCGRENEYKKVIGNKQIHIKWKGKGMSYAGYYAHIDKYPHI